MTLQQEQAEDLAYRAEMLRRAGERLIKEARELAARSEAMVKGVVSANEMPAGEEESMFVYAGQKA